MVLPLAGKTAIVTGSSKGIGKAIALQLAADGADVAVCARSENSTAESPGSIGETVDQIVALGRRAIPIRMDVTNDGDVRCMVAKVCKEFGRIDIVVNNAGATGGATQFLGGDPTVLDLFYRTNVRAPYYIMQLVGDLMARAGGGTFVNISSNGARNLVPPNERPPAPPLPANIAVPSGIGPAYGISKAALDRISTAYANELFDKNIAVITVIPGYTMIDRTLRKLAPNTDTSNMESPEVTARAVAFVCRDPMSHTGIIRHAKTIVQDNNL